MINRNLSLETVSSVVCGYYDVKESDIFIRVRDRDILSIRQVFHYFASKFTKRNLNDIGNYLNCGFDHSTVIHSRNLVNNLVDTDEKFKETISYLNYKLKELSSKNFDIQVEADIINIKNEIDNISTRDDLNQFLLTNIILN